MKNGFKIFDADMHIMEDLKFVEYMDPEYRDRGPKATPPDESFPDFTASTLEGIPLSGPAHIYPAPEMRPGAALSRRSFAEGMAKYVDGRADGFGPKSQMLALETEGIDVAAMYPSSTILSFPTPKTNGLDPKLSAAICKGYNDWLTDFCSADSARMKGVAATPIHDVEESVIEITRAVKENSMIAAYIRPNVINGRNLHDAYYEPLYEALEELNIPLVVHEGTAGGPPGADQRFLGNWVMMHMAAHPLEQMLGSESIVVGGVLERHPKLRVAFLECGCSWLVYWLWRLDEELEAWGWHEVPWLKKKPSEYFMEQCYVSMEGDEPGAKYYVEMYGNDRLLWASDYPHPDAGYPNATEEFLGLETISEETKRKVLWDNPMGFYGL